MRAKLDDTDTPTLDPHNDVERTGDTVEKSNKGAYRKYLMFQGQLQLESVE